MESLESSDSSESSGEEEIMDLEMNPTGGNYNDLKSLSTLNLVTGSINTDLDPTRSTK